MTLRDCAKVVAHRWAQLAVQGLQGLAMLALPALGRLGADDTGLEPSGSAHARPLTAVS